MASYNKVILVGNVTRDVLVRYTPSGVAVTEIGVAVNDKRKDASGNWVDDVLFVDVTCWGKQAEVAGEYLSKGSPVLIDGRLKLDQWTDKDGAKKYKLKVVSDRWTWLGQKGERVVRDRNAQTHPQDQSQESTASDESPL